jgi:hypothetical protein
VESFELELSTWSFGAISTTQSEILIHHSIKVVERCHSMPSQVQRRRLWLVVDVDDCAMVAKGRGGCKIHRRLPSRYVPNIDRRRIVLGLVNSFGPTVM